MDERMTLSVEETAEHLGIGRNRAYDLIRRGDLPSLRIGRSIRVPREALNTWITRQTIGSKA